MPELSIDLEAHPRRQKARLRLSIAAIVAATQRLDLPTGPTSRSVGDATALWLGPDQWLLVSDAAAASDLTRHITGSLGTLPHHMVDVSAAFACARLQGGHVRDLLAMGSGLDWSQASFRPGDCRRTRFARIAVVAHAVEHSCFELYYDRSYRYYLERWLGHALSDPLLTRVSCPITS